MRANHIDKYFKAVAYSIPDPEYSGLAQDNSFDGLPIFLLDWLVDRAPPSPPHIVYSWSRATYSAPSGFKRRAAETQRNPLMCTVSISPHAISHPQRAEDLIVYDVAEVTWVKDGPAENKNKNPTREVYVGTKVYLCPRTLLSTFNIMKLIMYGVNDKPYGFRMGERGHLGPPPPGANFFGCDPRNV